MEWQVGDYAQITSFPTGRAFSATTYYEAHLRLTVRIVRVEDTYVESDTHGVLSKKFLTNITKQELIKRFNQFVIL